MTISSCASCGAKGRVDHHHLVPRALGGAALPTVPLCRKCHGAVHGVHFVTNHSDLVKAGIARAKAERAARLTALIPHKTKESYMSKRLGMTQTEWLLDFLLEGNSITRMEAMHYGFANLTARIADLRNDGWDVLVEKKVDALGARYGRWSISASDRAMAA